MRVRVTRLEPAGSPLVFELTAPGMKHPDGRIDRLEPPANAGRGASEAMQALSICFSVAQRRGGDVRVVKDGASGSVITFTCPVVG